LPLIQDFTAGRGNGNYLFLAGLAPGLVGHAVSAVFCVMFAVGLRSFVLLTALPSRLAHVPAKWNPVRRQGHAPKVESTAFSFRMGSPVIPSGRKTL
jgi:hypothetical protein